MSEQEKNKKRKYRYHNMSEEKKQRLKESQKLSSDKKSLNVIINKIILIAIQIKYFF